MPDIPEEAVSPTPESGDDWKTLSARLNEQINIYCSTHSMADLEEAISVAEALDKASQENHLRVQHIDILDTLGALMNQKHSKTRSREDLERAIQFCERAVQQTSENDRYKAIRIGVLGQLLNFRYELTAKLSDLEEAIRITRLGMEAAHDQNHEARAEIFSDLGSLLDSRHRHSGNMADLDDATRFAREALRLTGQDDRQLPGRLSNLGNRMYSRYSHTRLLDDLTEAIKLATRAICIRPSSPTGRSHQFNNLAIQLGELYQLEGTQKAIKDAIDYSRVSIKAAEEGSVEWADRQHTLGSLLQHRYSRDHNREDLEEAISAEKKAVEAAPQGGIIKARYLNRLGSRHGDRYLLTKVASDLKQAICLTKEALKVMPEDAEDRSEALHNLAGYLDDRYNATETIEDFEESLHFMTESLKATPTNHPAWPARCGNVGLRLGTRYSRTGNPDDLEKAIAASRKALKGTPEGHRNRPDCLNNLSTNLGHEYKRTGNEEVMLEAVQLAKDAVRCVSEDHPSRISFLTNLGNRMDDLFTHTGEISALEEATRLAREALEADRDRGHGPRTSLRMNNLGERLRKQYLRTRNVDDLNEAIELGRQGIASNLIAMDHPDRPQHSTNLAVRLGDRYSLTGSRDDLDEAIMLVKEAIEQTDKSHPDRSLRLNTLGSIMGDKYARTGHLPDLDEAIDIGRKAADAGATGHPGRQAEYLSNLSNRLSDRNSHTGAFEDIVEAVKIVEQAVETIPPGHPDRTMYMNNLALHLRNKNARIGAKEDLDRAVSISREALMLLPSADHPERAPILSTVGLALADRFLAENHPSQDATEDIDEAIWCVEEAVRITPKGSPDRVKYLNDIGNFAGIKYQRLCRPEDLRKGIEASREAAETSPENHPDRAAPLSNLGRLLGKRGEPTDVEEARSLFATVLNLDHAAIRLRIDAGRFYFATTDVCKNSQEAYEIAQKTISMVSIFAPLSLRPTDKQHLLSQAVGLAPDAAAIALHVHRGHPAKALELLERGRGIIARSLQNMRADLSKLRRSWPELASSFEGLRNLLDRRSMPSNGKRLPRSMNSGSVPAGADDRHLASAKMDSVLSQIRRKPGFEDFLGAATEAQMREAAALGPVVVVNVSRYNCVAIVVEHTGIRVLDLNKLTYAAVESKVCDIRRLDCLDWLWEVIVRPVLDFLGFHETPSAGDPWPHVWWIPTGPLVGFPLHAAGHHLGNKKETALDRVISSYSSSIQALIHARQRQHAPLRSEAMMKVKGGGDPAEEVNLQEEPKSKADVVLVSMPETPGNASLAHAGNEIEAVKQACEAMGLTCVQPASRQKKVLAALNNSCRVFHFAGHGSTHSTDPMESRLLLEDWHDCPLTVGSLLDSNLDAKAPFLAYLSACGTSQILDNRVVDENIHLASAFQLAGFRHVIATLWEVDDILCVDTAKMTYLALCDGKMTDVSVSEGLHHTLRQLRDNWARSNGFRVADQSRYIPMANTETGVLEQIDSLRLNEHEASMTGDARAARTIEKTENTTPLWVPYVHFGP